VPGHVNQRRIFDRMKGSFPAHVCCRELPGCVPVTHHLEACVRLCKPWTGDCDVHLVSGQLCIKAPLRSIVAAGYGESVVKAMRNLPDWLLQTLEWPHSVLRFVGTCNPRHARRHLEHGWRGAPVAPEAWAAAGVYAKVFLGDDVMAVKCLQKGEGGRALAGLATDWAALFHDHGNALRCLQLTRGDKVWPDKELYLAAADAWAALPDGQEQIARSLTDAETCSAGWHPGPFRLALAWAALQGDFDRARACAQRGMFDVSESLGDALLFWRCMPDGIEMADQCLKKSGWKSTVQARLAYAEGIIMRYPGDDPEMHGWAKNIILRAVARPDERSERLKWAATRYSALFGNGAEAILTKGARSVKETCDALSLAEGWMEQVHLTWDDRRGGCEEMLTLAQSLAADPMDFSFCATAWKRLLGDHAAADRCR
jgi:hypothetical protein